MLLAGQGFGCWLHHKTSESPAFSSHSLPVLTIFTRESREQQSPCPQLGNKVKGVKETSKDQRGDASQGAQCLVLLSDEPLFWVNHNAGAFTDVWNEEPEVYTFPHHPGRTKGSLKQKKMVSLAPKSELSTTALVSSVGGTRLACGDQSWVRSS